MPEWSLRLRAILDSHYATVVVALVVLGMLGGWLTYGAYVAPGTHAEERTVSSWRTTGQFDHGATVTEENSVFPEGTRLSNRTTYFRTVAPVLDGTFRSAYSGAQNGDLAARVDVTLVLRSVDGEGESRTEYWRTTRSLGQREVDSLSPGESVSVPFSVDVDAVENRTNRIRQELGGQPGEVRLSVVATVRYAGTVDGQSVDRTVEYSLPLGIGGGTYQVQDPGSTEERHEKVRTVTVNDEPGLVGAVGGPLALLVALGSVGALVYRDDEFELTDTEREYLEFREDRSDFDEWIVMMRLPDEALDLPRAEAQTLGDLVDFAIDTDNAVAENPDTGTFSVVHDGYRYVYDPPSRPTKRDEGATDRDDGSGEKPDERVDARPEDDRSDPQKEGADERPPPAE